jgi:integrase
MVGCSLEEPAIEHGLGVRTPLRPGNCWRRHIGPKLRAAGLESINFQVLRRSCSSLMNDEGIDSKVISDQLGHTLDVGWPWSGNLKRLTNWIRGFR